MNNKVVSASQFAWRILGGEAYPPQPPHAPAPDYPCWLCGGDTDGDGWQRDLWLTPTFTNHNLAACITSPTICQSCVALASKDTWERYVLSHPEMGLKTGHAMSWRNYSHVFSAAGHECPIDMRRASWTLADAFVTCPKCAALIRARNKTPNADVTGLAPAKEVNHE